MHVLGHYDVAVHVESVLRPNALQRGFKGPARLDASEIWSAVITAERQEVKLAGLVETFESPGHGERLSPQLGSCL